MTRKRIFVAIDLPDSLRKILADLNPNIRGVRWTEPQIVLKLYWKNGKVKAELGVGQGKVAGDKRADLKKRAIDREMAREVARFNRKHGH